VTRHSAAYGYGVRPDVIWFPVFLAQEERLCRLQDSGQVGHEHGLRVAGYYQDEYAEACQAVVVLVDAVEILSTVTSQLEWRYS
jgi:hypothetical protein